MKKILFILFTAFAICSCNNSDDITEIFQNHTWELAFFQEGTTRTPAKDNYTIQFYENVFVASTPSGSEITGEWNADDESREFKCRNMKINGDISNDATAIKMETFLKKATYYSGDANWLQIKQSDNIYMQFYNR